MNRGIVYKIALTTMLSFSSLLVLGQVNQAPSKPDSTIKVIKPIQLSNIGTATEETLSKLRQFRTDVQVPATELAIDSIILNTLAKIEDWRARMTPEQIETMRIRQTETVKADFENFRNSLVKWRRNYTEKTEKIYLLQLELSELKTKWQLTLNLERQEPLPEKVKIRINDNLVTITEVGEIVNERNNSLLNKQTELTSALVYIDDGLSAISKVERAYKEQILSLDMPPIWRAFTDSEDSTSIKSQINRSIEKHQEELIDFQANYRESIYGHVLFLTILLILTFLLKSEVKKWPDQKKDESNGLYMVILSRPISSALLIALFCSGMFYTNVPSDVLNYFYIPLLIPLLYVIPLLVPGLNKKHFYFIAFVFFLSQVTDHFSDIMFIERLMLLVINGLSIAILLKILGERREIMSGDSNIRWGLTFKLIRFTIIILAISIFANIIGNTFFSRVVSRGTLIMIFGGIIIYAGTLVIRGIFSLLIQTKNFEKLNIIKNYSNEVKHQVFRILNGSAVLYWLYLTLEGFLLFDVLFEWVMGVLWHEWVVGSISLSLGSILAFFITLWLSLLVSKFIRFILQDEILTHFQLPRGVPGAISMIVRLTLIFLGFILAFGAAKIDMSNVAIVFGALGVGIGFGLQNIFNNLVSGLILAFERPVQVGDVIQISSINIMGEVKEIGIRASTVRTFDGAEVIVPNGNLISNEMINWTLSDNRRRQEVIIGVAYGTDTEKVIEILQQVVIENEMVLDEPEPKVLFLGFGDSSLNFRVLFWAHFENGFVTKSEVGVAIDTALKKAGITIPFPQRDLHLKSASEQSKLVKKSLKK